MEIVRRQHPDIAEAVAAYLALSFDRFASFNCMNVRWKLDAMAVVDAFARYALPVLWDFAEVNTIGDSAGAFTLCFERIATALDNLLGAGLESVAKIVQRSALENAAEGPLDVVATDPPYYDAIPYSDLMDFFYIWLRRTLVGASAEMDTVFAEPAFAKVVSTRGKMAN